MTGRPRGLPRRTPPELGLHLELGPALPGWFVRLLAPAVLLVLVPVTGGSTGAGFVAAAGAAMITWQPQWRTAPALVLLTGLWVLSGPDRLADVGGAGPLQLALLVLGTHLVLRLSALAQHVAWSGDVETAVLGRALASVLVLQLAPQTLLVVVTLVRSGVGIPGADALRLVAVVAVVALALVAVPREWSGRRPTAPF